MAEEQVNSTPTSTITRSPTLRPWTVEAKVTATTAAAANTLRGTASISAAAAAAGGGGRGEQQHKDNVHRRVSFQINHESVEHSCVFSGEM